MNDNDPTEFIEKAMPEAPPPARFDLDRVVSDGYRGRRRHRAALGGAATMGVAVLAAVTALAVNLNATPPNQQAAEGFEFDAANAMAGYPFDNMEWNSSADAYPQAMTLTEAAKAAFGDLMVEAGYVEAGDLDYEAPAESEIQALMDEHGMNYGEALSELDYGNLPLQFVPSTSPGNSGQVYLRSYLTRDGDEEAETPAFTIEAMLPGGWTAEPGPVGDVAFPQHLISDDAEEFTTEDLDDGRRLMVADDGCSYDLAVVYPNGSGLRSSWDLGCSGERRDVSLEALTEAMLAMPETDYDTSELIFIEELVDVPARWSYDEQWEAAAAEDAQTSVDGALDVIDEAYPGVETMASGPQQIYSSVSGSFVNRVYAADGRLPTEDDAGNPVHFSMRYTLPGGWLPGYSEEGDRAEMYLVTSCSDGEHSQGEECRQTEVEGRTVVTRTTQMGETHSYSVYVFDPDGWAVELSTTFEGEIDGLGYDELVALTASLPAPVYDEDAVPATD